MIPPSLTPRLQETFDGGLRYLKGHYGRNGLKKYEEIHPDIHWTPSYHLKVSGALIVAAEVSDDLYPRIVKEALADIHQFDWPIALYVICPLEVYMADQKQTVISRLAKQGIGIITVDDSGRPVLQRPCTPIVQNISEEELEALIRSVSAKLKNKFRLVRETYQTNVGQGLQEAGQVVEAVVKSLADGAASKGWVPAGIRSKSAAEMIDELYQASQFQNYRAALGGARNFLKDFRNIASHPERTSRQLLEKIKSCRSGVCDAIKTSHELMQVARACRLRIRVV